MPVKTVAQFFAAADGSDGRNASRHAARLHARAAPPANLLFVHSLLASLRADSGDDDEQTLRMGLRAVTKWVGSALLS